MGLREQVSKEASPDALVEIGAERQLPDENIEAVNAPQRAPAAAPVQQEMSDDELLQAMGEPGQEEESGMSDQELLGIMNPPKDVAAQITRKLTERGFFTKVGDRAIGGLGRNAKETKTLLNKRFGNKNVKIKDGEIEVRNSGKDSWRPLDPDDEGFGDGLQEFALDVADLGGDMVESVLAMGVEMGAITMAAPLAVPSGGLSVPASIVAGAGAGAVVGSQARQGLIEAAGGEVDEDLASMEGQLANAGLNMAFAGGFAAVGKMFRSTKGLISDFRNSGGDAVKQNAVARKIVEEMKDIPVESTQEAVSTGGKAVKSAIEKAHTNVGIEIGFYKDKAIEVVGNQRFLPEAYIEKLHTILSDSKYAFDKSTGMARKTKDFAGQGIHEDSLFMGKISDEYNKSIREAVQEGGRTIEQLFSDATKMALNSSQRKGKDLLNDNGTRLLSQLSNALTTDKTRVTMGALEGNKQIQELLEPALEQYAGTIHRVGQLRQLWSKTGESGDQFVRSIFNKNSKKSLDELGKILGPESQDFKMLSSIKLAQMTEDAVSKTNGIFDPKKMMKELNDLGPDVRDKVMSKENFRRMQVLAKDFESSKIGQLTNSPKDQKKLQAMIILAAPHPFVLPKAKAAWSLIGKDVKAAEYLLNDGWREMAESAASATERDTLLKTRNLFNILMNNSQKVTNAQGREVFASTPITRNILRTTRLDGTRSMDPEDTPEGEVEEKDSVDSLSDMELEAILGEE
jgi:hypothetical protein